MTRLISFGLPPTLWRRVWQSVIKKSLCRSIRRSPIRLIVMASASLRSTFTCTTMSLTKFLTTQGHQPSAKPLGWGSSASTRKGSLVGVEVDHLPPRHPQKHQSVHQRLVPHQSSQMGQHPVPLTPQAQSRVMFRALIRPPDLRMVQRLHRHLFRPLIRPPAQVELPVAGRVPRRVALLAPP
jgi:hypothetical protein